MVSVAGAAVFAATFSFALGNAHAASAVQKECSEKYQAAKSANSLNGMSYNQFYSQCAAAAKAGPAPAAAAPAPAAASTAAAPPETKAELKAEKKAEKAKEKAEKKEEKEREKAAKKGEPAPTPAATAPAAAPAPAAPAPTTTAAKPAPAAPVATGNAVFPSAISASFSKESAGKARMHTCLAQYNANKTSNGNGGLKWIEKGGGYYSECNKRLKG
jgi:outer membrane biosynthesis protein TonB